MTQVTEGLYGDFGGRFMPEALISELDRLTAVWKEAMADPAFTGEFQRMLREYAGVPSLLYDATRLSEVAGALGAEPLGLGQQRRARGVVLEQAG